MGKSSTYYPPPSFYFRLSFSGISGQADAGFQEASGISTQIETEEVVCGGENRFKYKLPKTIKSENLILKRGLVTTSSQLAAWCKDTLTSDLGTVIQTKSIMLSLLGAEGKPLMSWSFVNAYPVKWSVSDFKSQENSLSIETLEFAYSYFKKV
ncbi:MAG: phage tail protein [Reichenbachiella sp.]|uniref:phage tail protein n=1 Tax=Reichenbachiella sp. TaxID=2184521 RepID=UPI00296720B2|nr:phage tail protein [Reichenbachiella sp.]MDW3211152.1 phage tail protein [Reichenbachiella sp.]